MLRPKRKRIDNELENPMVHQESNFENQDFERMNSYGFLSPAIRVSLISDEAVVRRKLRETEEILKDLQGRIRYDSEPVNLKEGSSYSSGTIKAVIKLKALGVADEKIGPVMTAVAELLEIQIDSTPSATFCRRMGLATLNLSQEHIKSTLADYVEKGESLCLMTDETTKGTVKVQQFGIQSSSGTYLCVGLTQVVEKSAQTAFEAFRTTVGRLPDVANNFFDKLLVNVRSTMSDSAPTEQKFQKIVENYRNSVIPEVVEEFDDWSDEEKEKFSKMFNFYCQLHILANFTKVALKSILEHELLLKKKGKSEEPTVLSLIKLVSQLFGQRGARLHGIVQKWSAWCKEKEVNRFTFESFVGNRFNIVLFVASRVFYHRQNLIDFAKECEDSKAELKNIREMLEDPMIVSHLQVLGFCDQMITAPLWRTTVANGDVWAEMRRFALLAFRTMGVGRELIEEKILDELDFRCAEIDAASVNGKTIVHTSDLFDLTVGNVINSVLVGKRFDASNMEEFLKLKGFLDSTAELFTIFDLVVPVWVLQTFFPVRFARVVELQQEILNFVSREALAKYEQVKSGEYTLNPDDPQNFVEAYLVKIEEEKKRGNSSMYSMECLKHVIGDLWLAGQDTTATTLVSGFNQLVNNPDVIKKCREEILKLTDNGSRPLKLKDRAESHYLNATIAEIQRHASILNVNFWRINHEPTIVKGYPVDSGSVITAQLGALHVNDDIFKNPDKFYPERFIENDKLINQVIPFGIGKRSCVGENIARSELYLIIGNLIQRYDVKPHGSLPTTEDQLPYSAGKF